MIYSRALFLLVLLLAAVTAVSAAPTAKEKYHLHGFRYDAVKIKTLAPEEFLIMPWGWTPNDAQVLKDVKECGFNLAGFVAPEHVKAVKRAGLKCFVDDPSVSTLVADTNVTDAELTKKVDAMVKKFKNDPTVYGYYVIDEPSPPLYANLARFAKAIRKASPNAVPYINMLPGWGPEYENNYIQPFVDTVHPTYLSYDNYSLLDNGVQGQGFFMNLESIRKISLKQGIPFYNIILANSHFTYAEVTRGGLYYQVFSSLAYGVKGISYFTYFDPLIGNYRSSAVDQFLHKTPTWEVIRQINMQIHQLGPTYLKLKSVNVFHQPDVPQFCQGIASSKHMEEVSGGNFVVGEFESADGTPFIMLVNKNITKSTSFHVKFKHKGTVMMTNPYTGLTEKLGGENGWLAPGGGVLLSVI